MTHQPIPFRYTFGITKAEQRADGFFITGEASGPEIDATNERMAPEAIRRFSAQITAQAANGTPLPYRDAHAQDGVWRDLGEITRAWIDERLHLGVEVKLDEDSSAAMYLFKQLQKGKKYGMSIAGTVLDYADEFVSSVGRMIRTYKDIVLTEISNTTRPAWTPSFGTVLSKAIDEATAESIAAQGENVDPEETTLAAGEPVETTPADDVEKTEETPVEVTDGEATEKSEEDAAAESEVEKTDEPEADASDEDVEKSDEEPAAEEATEETTEKADEAGTEAEEDVEKASHAADDLRSLAFNVASLAGTLADDLNDTNSAETQPKLRAAMEALIGAMGSELAQVGTPGDVLDTVAEQLANNPAMIDSEWSDKTSDPEATEKSDETPAADEAAETEETEKASEETESDVEKAGRSISAANAARLMGLYGQMTVALKEMGLLDDATETAPAKSDSTDAGEPTLVKSLQDANADLGRQVEDLTKALNEKTARIEELEAMPADAPPLIEHASSEAEQAAAAIKSMAPGDRIRAGLSLAHRE